MFSVVIRIRIEPIEESLRALQANLRASRKVVYVRFGDNDLFHMVGKDGRGRYLRRPIGRNKTAFSETLQSDLLQAIRVKHPFYMRAVGARWRVEPLMQGTFFAGNRVPKCLPRYIKKVLPRDRQFFHPVLFSYLACLEPEKWRSFCEEFLHPKRKIFVGSLDPDKLTPLGKFDGWVRTPYQNAPRYTAEAKKLLADQVRQGDMVILGCMSTTSLLSLSPFFAWNST